MAPPVARREACRLASTPSLTTLQRLPAAASLRITVAGADSACPPVSRAVTCHSPQRLPPWPRVGRTSVPWTTKKVPANTGAFLVGVTSQFFATETSVVGWGWERRDPNPFAISVSVRHRTSP